MQSELTGLPGGGV